MGLGGFKVQCLKLQVQARASGLVSLWCFVRGYTAAGGKFVASPCLRLKIVQTPLPRRLLHQQQASNPPFVTIKEF